MMEADPKDPPIPKELETCKRFYDTEIKQIDPSLNIPHDGTGYYFAETYTYKVTAISEARITDDEATVTITVGPDREAK